MYAEYEFTTLLKILLCTYTMTVPGSYALVESTEEPEGGSLYRFAKVHSLVHINCNQRLKEVGEQN